MYIYVYICIYKEYSYIKLIYKAIFVLLKKENNYYDAAYIYIYIRMLLYKTYIQSYIFTIKKRK